MGKHLEASTSTSQHSRKKNNALRELPPQETLLGWCHPSSVDSGTATLHELAKPLSGERL